MDYIHWKLSNTTRKIMMLVISLQEECDWFLKYKLNYLLIPVNNFKILMYVHACPAWMCICTTHTFLMLEKWDLTCRSLQADMFVLGANAVSSDRPSASSGLNPWAVSAASLRLMFLYYMVSVKKEQILSFHSFTEEKFEIMVSAEPCFLWYIK